MRYRAVLLFYLLMIQGNLFSQRRVLPDDTGLALAGCLTTGVDSFVVSPWVHRQFTTVIVVDDRFDKMKLGYFYTPQKNELRKVCTKENVAQELAAFLNNYFSAAQSQTTDSVLIYVKKLWIKNEDPYKDRKDFNISEYSLRFRAEFYLKRQSCFNPLYRFDSTLLDEGSAEKIPGMLLRKALIASTRKLNRANLHPPQPVCLSSKQIDSFNRASWNTPVLKEGISRKGIYFTFNQFKNNQPAIVDFNISFGERADFLTVGGKSIQDSILSDVWGFSDGATVYIRTGKNFFPLFRSGDNFEFYAFTKITVDRPHQYRPSSNGNTRETIINNATGLLFGTITNKSSDIRLYTLDIETGKVH